MSKKEVNERAKQLTMGQGDPRADEAEAAKSAKKKAPAEEETKDGEQ